MKLTLMIEASAGTIAQILANLPDDASVTIGEPAPPAPPMPGPVVAPPVATAPPAPPVMPQPPAPPVAAADDDGPVNANAPSTDNRGFPWDERIHASTKGISATGEWRRRRGVDDVTFAAVEAELRSRVTTAPPPPPVTTAPPPIAAAPPPPVMPPAAPVVAPLEPPPPPTMTAPPMPVAVPPMPANPEPVPMVSAEPVATTAIDPTLPATVSLDFNAFMAHIAGQMGKMDGAGQPLINAGYLANVTARLGQQFGFTLNAITDIASRPDMIDAARTLIQTDQRW